MRTLRRIVLGICALAVAFVTVIASVVTWTWSSADVSTVGTTEFTRPLHIPPLADSSIDADGTRVFSLDMRAGTTEFEAGRATETWGFNGSYLGPTLRANRGEKVRVRVRNALPEASTVHWHGMHLPAEMDGGPHQMVEPGDIWSPEWTVAQPASTLWYHPHPHGETEDHVRRGLAGMFLVDDGPAPALPSTYGVDDLPVIVQDVRLRDNRLDGAHEIFRNSGFLGDRTMVNGTLNPYHEVGDELVRLRLLNASTARVYTFAFDDIRPFALVGTDGGLLERPATLDRVRLSPGERAEIVVRMRPGERTVLRSGRLDVGMDFWGNRFSGGDDSFDVLELRAAETLRTSEGVPEYLAAQTLPNPEDSVAERRFELAGMAINGNAMAMDRIDTVVTRGATETWVVVNVDGQPHNFHVHDVRFRITAYNGGLPPPELSGAKDTVFLPPNTTARLVLRFDGPADPDTPYMYHCHLLWHEDQGMMGQFVVVEPGQAAATLPGHEH